MNGSISVSLDCFDEVNANQMYTYNWGDLDPNMSQGGNRDNLAEGEYYLTVTDDTGSCEYTSCWTIEREVGEIPQPVLVSQENIT